MQVDVLIPEGVGQRAARLNGAGGAPTISSPGTTQALQRTEALQIIVGERTGTILRPNLVWALVLKAAAGTEIVEHGAKGRHLVDFVTLAGLIAAVDFREANIGRKDRHRLRRMACACRADGWAMSIEGAPEGLTRLERLIAGTERTALDR